MNGSTKFWIVFLSFIYVWLSVFTFINIFEDNVNDVINPVWIVATVIGIGLVIGFGLDDFNDWLDRIFK